MHFSDDATTEQEQRRAYTLLCGQICELRYLTSQMGGGGLAGVPWPGRRVTRQATLYDHNMAQALMLLMESAAQRAANQNDVVKETQDRARAIADRALDMAIRRVTVDNTIRYVRMCIVAGGIWIAMLLAAWLFLPAQAQTYVLASIMGATGAVFSVIVRAQAFELKPCDDSRLNKWIGATRIGMGGIAGPILVLLIETAFPGALKAMTGDQSGDLTRLTLDVLPMVAILGLVGGFAERLVPNLVRTAADKVESRAGTPVQASTS